MSDMKTDLYDIKTLCTKTGVTPRTVHFYIQQGLLPPAGTQGPGARYDQGHMARLRLIKLLQREHLPLSEIRRRLESLDDPKVEELLREYRSRKPEASSAVDYIRGVLTGARDQVCSTADAASALWQTTPQATERWSSVSGAGRAAERSQWERVVLAPDIELHIRRPLARVLNRKIEALIQHAREILKEES